MIPVVHHSDYVAPTTHLPRHNKNAMIRDLLIESKAALEWIEPEAMPLRWLERVHCPDYVAEVVEARVPAAKERRIGFSVTPLVALRSQRVPGGTYEAALLAMSRGYAANTGGGSHHALHDTGAGYCVFNDLAVAAVRFVEEGRGRVLVVDCDVHQGDGTAALTAGRTDIATFSIHAEKNFPVRKARSTVDVALPDGTGDAEYLAALEGALSPLTERFAPDVILYQAGVDPLAEDRLGRLALTQGGLDARDRMVARLAGGVPIASTPGGGYGPDVGEIAGRHVRTILTLAESFGLLRLPWHAKSLP